MANQQKQIRILYLTSTTFDHTAPVPNFPAVEQTITRSTNEAIQQHNSGITVEFKHVNLTRYHDLFAAIHSFNPSVLILFTHATEEGVFLNDGNHHSTLVDNAALKTVIKYCLPNSNLKTILLYACWSKVLATELSSIVDCVIGMAQPITDVDVNDFSASFFSAVGSGASLSAAFDMGKTLLRNKNAIPVPVDKFKDGVDPSTVLPYAAVRSARAPGGALPTKVANSTMLIGDMSKQAKYQLKGLLDPELRGIKPAIALALRMEWTSAEIVGELAVQESSTEALLHQLALYGNDEQQTLRYLYQKLVEDPPMNAAATIVQKSVIY